MQDVVIVFIPANVNISVGILMRIYVAVLVKISAEMCKFVRIKVTG